MVFMMIITNTPHQNARLTSRIAILREEKKHRYPNKIILTTAHQGLEDITVYKASFCAPSGRPSEGLSSDRLLNSAARQHD